MFHNRIDSCLASIRAQKRTGLSCFLMAGDPDLATSQETLAQLPSRGVDLIELGMPFSDPMADGPILQAAGKRALQNGQTMRKTLQMVRLFRQKDTTTPLVLMGYYNPVYQTGIDAFGVMARQAGADGVLLVDVPLEMHFEIAPALARAELHLIHLVAPTSLDARLGPICRQARGFLYYVAVTGITGQKTADIEAHQTALREVRRQSSIPVVTGFGIRTQSQLEHLRGHADAVVIGSAFVDRCHREGSAAALAWLQGLRAALEDKT